MDPSVEKNYSKGLATALGAYLLGIFYSGQNNYLATGLLVGSLSAGVGVALAANHQVSNQSERYTRAAGIVAAAAAGATLGQYIDNPNTIDWKYSALVGLVGLTAQKLQQEMDYRTILPNASVLELL